MEYNWKITAARLKKLRNEYKGKGISHDALSKALKEEYGEKISASSLKNYEVSDPYHTKAKKVEGMSIRNLYCLADFFGVSTDYLLGKTKHRTPNTEIRAICDYTGLSPEAVEALHSQLDFSVGYALLNDLILSDHGIGELIAALFTGKQRVELCLRELEILHNNGSCLSDYLEELLEIKKDVVLHKYDSSEWFSELYDSITGYKEAKATIDATIKTADNADNTGENEENQK